MHSEIPAAKCIDLSHGDNVSCKSETQAYYDSINIEKTFGMEICLMEIHLKNQISRHSISSFIGFNNITFKK